MTVIPLPGCCNCCHEPVTNRQKSVLFEGPNLRYPQLDADTAVFHTRKSCQWDARSYDECWAMAVPGRVQKFPGWYTGEFWLKLIEATRNHDPSSDAGVPVNLRFTGGVYDGASMHVVAAKEITEVLYVEPVPRPKVPEPGAWYLHAGDCPCGATGSKSMPAGDHVYRPKPDTDT